MPESLDKYIDDCRLKNARLISSTVKSIYDKLNYILKIFNEKNLNFILNLNTRSMRHVGQNDAFICHSKMPKLDKLFPVKNYNNVFAD